MGSNVPTGCQGRGILFVVSAPSGAGKTTLVKRLTKTVRDIRPSVSRTTRPPRKGEKNGKHYRFVSEDAFDRMVAAGEFLEWAVVHGHRYGTPREEIERARRARVDLVLSIDVKGAAEIRASGEPSVGIFLLPPSFRELERRLVARGEDDRASIEARLAEGRREVRRASSYDYIVVNDVFEDAVAALETIVRTERVLAERRERR